MMERKRGWEEGQEMMRGQRVADGQERRGGEGAGREKGNSRGGNRKWEEGGLGLEVEE